MNLPAGLVPPLGDSGLFMEVIAGKAILTRAVQRKCGRVCLPAVGSLSARKAKPTAPGPNGIPYAAWDVEGSRVPDTLQEVFWALADGQGPSPRMNASLSVFIPKGADKTR